jgi:hypothetical protein
MLQLYDKTRQNTFIFLSRPALAAQRNGVDLIASIALQKISARVQKVSKTVARSSLEYTESYYFPSKWAVYLGIQLWTLNSMWFQTGIEKPHARLTSDLNSTPFSSASLARSFIHFFKNLAYKLRNSFLTRIVSHENTCSHRWQNLIGPPRILRFRQYFWRRPKTKSMNF